MQALLSTQEVAELMSQATDVQEDTQNTGCIRVGSILFTWLKVIINGDSVEPRKYPVRKSTMALTNPSDLRTTQKIADDFANGEYGDNGDLIFAEAIASQESSFFP